MKPCRYLETPFLSAVLVFFENSAAGAFSGTGHAVRLPAGNMKKIQKRFLWH
jgi:hypothetical protein